MRSKFRLQLEVVLDTNVARDVIETARQCYAEDGTASTVNEQGDAQTIPAEVFIDGIEKALMELLERNPLLAKANVEVEGVACRSASALPETGPFEWEDGEPYGEPRARPDGEMESGELEDDLE